MILPLGVMSELSCMPTTAGYNDGLSAVSSEPGLEPELSPEIAEKSSMKKVRV